MILCIRKDEFCLINNFCLAVMLYTFQRFGLQFASPRYSFTIVHALIKVALYRTVCPYDSLILNSNYQYKFERML